MDLQNFPQKFQANTIKIRVLIKAVQPRAIHGPKKPKYDISQVIEMFSWCAFPRFIISSESFSTATICMSGS